jgi:UDP-N-acetylglucosamine 2-epimerase (non-hydrolysing)
LSGERRGPGGWAKLRVMTIVGTRPEVIKLSRVIAELDRHTDHRLVHTGQNFDRRLNEVFFEELEIRPPDHFLGVAAGSTAATIANVVARADEVLARERPEALLLYGDTNSCLAAIAAKRRSIPVFHMEAGNRCFDPRVPEELNRKIVDHVSDVNLPLTEHARRYLLAEGLRPETVIVTGSPMPEVLAHYRAGIEASDVLARLGLEPGGYFVVSAHREENVDDPARLRTLLAALAALAAEHGRRIVVSTHPRTRQRLDALGDASGGGAGAEPGEATAGLELLAPFGFLDYVKLQQHAFCVLSDSGTLTEEAAILGFPAVMLRDAHERPEGMDAGVAVLSGLTPERVLQAVALVTGQGPRTSPVPDYGPTDVSRKVVRIILSHVDSVRRTSGSPPPP